MPLPRLPVRPANFRSIPFNQGADGRVAVHGLEHFETRAIDSNDRKSVVERRKPPFVGVVLVGDQIGDVPSQETEGFSGEMTGFVKSSSRLHSKSSVLGGAAYTSRCFSCKTTGSVWRLQRRRDG
jgi:hypothetical protein